MVNRILCLIVIIASTLSINTYAQTVIESTKHDTINKDKIGQLVIKQDNRLTKILDVYKIISSGNQGYDGFRIQIYSESSIDSSIEQAEEFLKTFKERFPDLKAYLNYYDPDFKIRVGNFRTKIECEHTLKRIKSLYSNCYTVRTFIPFKDLIEETPTEENIDSVEINQTLNK